MLSVYRIRSRMRVAVFSARLKPERGELSVRRSLSHDRHGKAGNFLACHVPADELVDRRKILSCGMRRRSNHDPDTSRREPGH